MMGKLPDIKQCQNPYLFYEELSGTNYMSEKIHKIQIQFIWGDKDGKYHLDIINWDKLSRTKKERGLGLRKLDNMNKACLVEIGQKFNNGDKYLWCNVLRGKYGRSNSTTRVREAKLFNSSLQKNLVNT